MMKLVRITDIKPMEIFPGRKTRGPVTMRMDNETIRRLLNQLDAPKGIYAVSKDDKKVKLTTKNYMLSEEELFSDVKKPEVKKFTETKEYKDAAPKVAPIPAEKKEEPKVEAPVIEKKEEPVSEAKLDSLKSSLQDLKAAEAKEDVKVEAPVTEKKEEKPSNNYNKKYNNYKKQ